MKDYLEAMHDRYNRPEFIEDDPICVPHSFSRKEDIELSGFFAALIAWGRRDMIIRNAKRLMELMDQAPYDFVTTASESELDRLEGFVHRTFNALDCKALILGLRNLYAHHGGLEGAFSAPDHAEDTMPGILSLRQMISTASDFPQRTFKHLANPAKGSSAKRLNMYLRWMVRSDNRGVDFGIWKQLDPAILVCPLDVHTGNVGRELGLLTRKQNDWKAAMELTRNLREFDPADPVKYDFSLFGLGVNEGFGKPVKPAKKGTTHR